MKDFVKFLQEVGHMLFAPLGFFFAAMVALSMYDPLAYIPKYLWFVLIQIH